MRPDLISFAAALGLAWLSGCLIGAGYMVGGAICLVVMCAFVWDLIVQWQHDEQMDAEDQYMGKTHDC